MCVATVGKIMEIKGNRAVCSFQGTMAEVSVALVPQVREGQYVLVHAGFAAEIVRDFPGYYRSTVATDAYAGHLLDIIAEKCAVLPERRVRIMNFCGSHEHTISQFGLRELLPAKIELVSGPGCPVCVTPAEEISLALAACQNPDIILTIYSDMLAVPTPWGTLGEEKAKGGRVRLVRDVHQALQLALQTDKQVVHYAVGFETTAPSTAAALIEAAENRADNFSVISSHRLTEPAMDYVLDRQEIDGVICPGNVAAITGCGPFRTINRKYALPMVVTGFEPVDVLEAVLAIVHQLEAGKGTLENQYARIVSEEGNAAAQQLMARVFQAKEAAWRGIPLLPESRLVLNDRYERFDAEKHFALVRKHAVPINQTDRGAQAGQNSEPGEGVCCCGEILCGAKRPQACPSFGRACTPDSPQGPCMVTGEGACRIQYTGTMW